MCWLWWCWKTSSHCTQSKVKLMYGFCRSCYSAQNIMRILWFWEAWSLVSLLIALSLWQKDHILGVQYCSPVSAHFQELPTTCPCTFVVREFDVLSLLFAAFPKLSENNGIFHDVLFIGLLGYSVCDCLSKSSESFDSNVHPLVFHLTLSISACFQTCRDIWLPDCSASFASLIVSHCRQTGDNLRKTKA